MAKAPEPHRGPHRQAIARSATSAGDPQPVRVPGIGVGIHCDVGGMSFPLLRGQLSCLCSMVAAISWCWRELLAGREK